MKLAALLLAAVLAYPTDAPAPGAREPARSGPTDATAMDLGSPCSSQPAVAWLGIYPHAPLCVACDGKIHPVPPEVSARWLSPGSRWRAIDEWGRATGTVSVLGRDYNECTRSLEPSLSLVEGAAGVGLLVSDLAWRCQATDTWTPSQEQLAALQALVQDLEASFGIPLDWPTGLLAATAQRFTGFGADDEREGRPLFFTSTSNELRDGEDAVVRRRWAVVGGKLLVVARLMDDGTWQARHVDARWAWLDGGFDPVAVIDLNADGCPEIIYVQQAFDWWNERVLSAPSCQDTWEIVVTGVGGSGC